MISLIIPFQNDASTLPFLLQSIVKQGNMSLQLIFINDHSSDNSLTVIDEFISKNMFKYNIIMLEDETGQGSAIRKAMKVVTEKYMMALSPIEILTPNALTDFIQAIEANEDTYVNTKNVACFANQSLQQIYPDFKYIGTTNATQITKVEDLFTDAFIHSPCLYRMESLEELGDWPIDYMSEGKYFSQLLVLGRLMKMGKIIFIPQIMSIHLQSDIKQQLLRDYEPVKQLIMKKVIKEWS